MNAETRDRLRNRSMLDKFWMLMLWNIKSHLRAHPEIVGACYRFPATGSCFVVQSDNGRWQDIKFASGKKQRELEKGDCSKAIEQVLDGWIEMEVMNVVRSVQ